MSKNSLTFLPTEKNPSSPWTGRLLFWQSLLKTFDERPLFFSSLSGNEWKFLIFYFEFLSSKCSFGQVECIFDNPDKNILREGREIFTHCPKMIRNSNFFKTKSFSPTRSSAHVECIFDNSWKSFGNRPKKLVQLPKMIEKEQFFRKFFPKSVLIDRWNECILTNPVKNLPQKAEKLTLTVRNWKKK